MNRIRVLFAFVSMGLVLVSRAFGGGLEPGYVGRAAAMIRADRGPALLLNAAVQKELKLSPEQITRINDLEQKLRKTANALEEKDAKMKLRAINAHAAKTAADLLKPEQLRRIRQIQMQVVGPAGFLDPEVAEKINLTFRQRQSVKEAYMEGRREAMRNDIKLKFGSKRIREFNTAALTKIMKLLTDEQRRAYSNMVGEPFQGRLPVHSGPLLRPEPKKR